LLTAVILQRCLAAASYGSSIGVEDDFEGITGVVWSTVLYLTFWIVARAYTLDQILPAHPSASALHVCLRPTKPVILDLIERRAERHTK